MPSPSGWGPSWGPGIFVVIGVSASLSGPALLVSLLIGAAVSALTAMSFAELATRIPKEGGGYEFAHELVSPLGGSSPAGCGSSPTSPRGRRSPSDWRATWRCSSHLPLKHWRRSSCIGVTGLNLWGLKGVGLVQRCSRSLQGRGAGAFRPGRSVPDRHGTISPPSRSEWTLGSDGRGRPDILRLLRVRKGGHVERGDQGPAADRPQGDHPLLVASTVIYLLVAATAIGLIGTAMP